MLRRFLTVASKIGLPTGPASLATAWAKVKRTNTQIEDLNTLLAMLFSASNCTIRSHLNANATQEAWVFHFPETPEDIPIRIGEILHNLRSSLDHLAVAIAIQHSGTSEQTYFPFGKTEEIFNGEVRRKTKHLPADAVEMIRAAQPYKGGNDLLWSIHDMNREDKHIAIAPVTSGFGFHMSEMIIHNSDFSIIGDRRGQYMTDEKGRAIIAKGPDPFIRKNECEFLTLAPGGKFQCDIQPTINVAFTKVPLFKGQPVAAVLNQMRNLTESLLLTFEKRFFA
jgi:hypothetical protein